MHMYRQARVAGVFKRVFRLPGARPRAAAPPAPGAQAREKQRSFTSERRLAVLLDDHALPNVGYGPKLSGFWYNRHCWAVLGARGPFEHSKPPNEEAEKM